MKAKQLLLILLALLGSITANAIESGDWTFEIISESACTARLMHYYGRGDGIITTPKTITDPSTGKAYSVTEIGKPSPGTATYYIVFDGYDGPFDGEEGWTIIISEGVQTIHEMAFNCLEHGTIYLPASLTTIYDPFSSDADNITIFIPLGFSLNLGLSNANIYTNPNITFYDDGVKELCVANWDTNGDGMLSKAEAAAVTSLGSVFKGNTSITSFNELQYFTGLTGISYDAFSECSNLTSIIIPNGVTYIGDRAFSRCSNLTSVTIPNSVEGINWYAFFQCSSLISITIPESVTYIDNGVFASCSSLTSVNIPNGVERICENTFSNCSSLTSITIPNTVCDIDKWAFRKCSNLISIDIPNSVKNISEEAFRDCISLTSVIIPNSIKEINNLTFSGCSGLTSVSIPNSVTLIGAQAFENCSSLTSVTIPNSVYLIGGGAFSGCSGLTSVTIPNSIKYLYSSAFWGCSSLRDVWCHAEDVPDNSGAFPTSVTECATLHVPAGSLSAYKTAHCWSLFHTIIAIDDTPIITFADANVKALCVANWDTSGDGELSEAEAAAVADLGEVFRGNTTITSFNELQYFTGLTTIGDNAFRECTALTSVTIPEGVQHIGYWAFCESGLTSITLPEGITNFCNAVFAGCRSLTSVEWPSDMTEIADYTFYQCSSLTSIHIPDGVTTIGHSAFRESGLESIAFPNSVTNIGSYVFDDCNNLTTVTMPASVITFDENDGNAFGDTNNIEAVYISDLTAWLNTSFPNANNPLRSGAKLYLNNVEVKDLVIPEGTTAILKAAFEGCESLTSVSIPNSVTSIDGWAFARCNNLTSVTIPESVTSIGGSAFKNCSSLTSINIPNGITSIEYETFSDCQALPSINIPNSVTSIGQNAFRGCQSLESVFIPESVTSIGTSAFQNCYELTSANLPNGITTINPYLFCGCKLNSITIPDGVTSIGDYAFHCCDFSTVVIPESVTGIGANAFRDCYELTSANLPNGITTINPYLFCGSPLTSIRIPNGVTSIGEWAFFSCNLSTIVIPENVESIGDNAFANCTLLTSVKVDIESPLSINSGTFYNSQANATLYVPYGSKAAYQAASYWQEFNNIIEFINGDVNSDYVTNVVDVVDIARFVVGTPAETFVEILADINRDGGVTVADAVALVNEIAGDQNFVKELYAPQVNNYDDEGCEVQLLKSGNNTLSFCLDGETDFTAFQFVMEVPEDTNVSAMRLNGNRKHGHQLIYNKVSDGTYRVVALSVSNNIFEGSEGELLGISLDGVPTDDICIRDIHFVNTAGKDFTYDKLVLGYDNETGLEGICTESLQKDGNAIYDLQGRQRTTLQPGINIVNGKKIMVK